MYLLGITERSYTALQAALTSGEWYIDNNKLTENSKYKTSSSSSTGFNYNKENQLSSTTSSIPSIIMNNSSSNNNNNNNNNATTTFTTPSSVTSTVELIPIKSFRNDYMNISVS